MCDVIKERKKERKKEGRKERKISVQIFYLCGVVWCGERAGRGGAGQDKIFHH